MKSIYLFSVICLVFTSCNSASDTDSSEDSNSNIEVIAADSEEKAVPEVCNDVKSFVRNGWKIVKEEKGDLNKDGVADVALVIQEDNSENVEDMDGIVLNSNPRELIILFGKAEKDCFELNTKSETFIVSHEDEIMEDPFDDIEIKNGTLRINFKIFYSMGSWTTSSYGYIWRYQDDKFKLIGANSSEFHRADGDGTDVSVNFSTKKYSITSYNMFDESVKEEVEWKEMKLKELKTFETFSEPWTWNLTQEILF